MRPPRRSSRRLREFLESLGLKLPGAGALQAGDFNRVLQRAKSMPVADLVNEIVLRSQSQAVYAAENLGHFGLHLRRYAHFTSPIRRYADLLVHRSLIRALGLGAGGLADEEAARLADIAQAISDTERRAMAAERETTDRLIAAYLADRVGAEFDARISGRDARPACSCACATPAPTASCRPRPSATTTGAITRTRTRWSATAPATSYRLGDERARAPRRGHPDRRRAALRDAVGGQAPRRRGGQDCRAAPPFRSRRPPHAR